MWICICDYITHLLNNLLCVLLGAEASVDQHDPNWYRLDFRFLLLVLYSDSIFSNWFSLYAYNLPFFPFFISIHFIFYNSVSTWIFYIIFQFLIFAIKTFIMLSFLHLLPPRLPLPHLKKYYFLDFLDIQNLCLPSSKWCIL